MFLLFIISLPLAILLFKLYNEIFTVYYRGFQGVIASFSACWTASVMIIIIPFLILQQFAIPILIIVVIILLVTYGKKKDKGTNAAAKNKEKGSGGNPAQGVSSPYQDLSDRQLILQFNQSSQERRSDFVPELMRRGYLRKDASGKVVQTGKQPT